MAFLRYSTVAVGHGKEDMARGYLEAHGLCFVDRNVRYSFGELDLIMLEGECLVFVEVRYRRNTRFGSPLETISWTKRQRIRDAASCYLQNNPTTFSCRFDVVAITGNQPMVWLRDAFRDD
ncbi:hypothetical protein TI04_06485 [Achromatium sp. WMS2]|nr:hypothetical protein TI04_06485 [Achromatium sp. WMS2]